MYYQYHLQLRELLAEHFNGKPLNDPRLENLLTAISEMLERATTERQNHELLKAAYNHMEQFAGVVAHDLRAPVRSISSLALWISEELSHSESAAIQEKMQLLQDKTAQLEKLINGIMSYSKAGNSSHEKDYVNLQVLLENTISLLGASEHLEIHLESEFPDIYTSRVPLQQIFLNLISNTIKHAGAGVQLRIRCGFSYNGLVFAFLDNGCGIPADVQTKLFDATNRSSGSGGIGLSITKRLIDENGGTLSLQSNHGKGTCISFDWPCEILTHSK